MPVGTVTSNSTQLLVSLVSSGRYLAIPPRTVPPMAQGRAIKVLPIVLRVGAQPVAVVTLRDRTLSPAAERVMRHLRETGASLVNATVAN
jgi:DNA-binding transcriptional LysR family regulator